jgi:hypothetical protein
VKAKPVDQAARLSGALQAPARGLPDPWDESTGVAHGLTAAMPVRTRLDAGTFRQALGSGFGRSAPRPDRANFG